MWKNRFLVRSCGWVVLLLIPATLGVWSVVAQEKQNSDKGSAAQEKPDAKAASVWMKQKLVNSEKILEGLTSGDLDLVARHASAMKALNMVEGFVRRDPPAYRTQLHLFQFSLDELVQNAQQGNLDGATLAFTQMTISCVNCHKHLRRS